MTIDITFTELISANGRVSCVMPLHVDGFGVREETTDLCKMLYSELMRTATEVCLKFQQKGETK